MVGRDVGDQVIFWRVGAIALLAILGVACRPEPKLGDPIASGAPRADSITLERTPCFGTCPSYHLSITSTGRVSFISLNPGDAGIEERDSISKGQFAALLSNFASVPFSALPARIEGDRAFCSPYATDHPSAILSLYAGSGLKRVVDYLGCWEGVDAKKTALLVRIRRLEDQVDSVAGSKRWVRPAKIGR